jgi:hypothetical protein
MPAILIRPAAHDLHPQKRKRDAGLQIFYESSGSLHALSKLPLLVRVEPSVRIPTAAIEEKMEINVSRL